MLLLPIVPFLSAVGMAVSACTMAWYWSLTKDQKERANRATASLAQQINGNCRRSGRPSDGNEDSKQPERLS